MRDDLISAKLRSLAIYDPDINSCRVHLDANESFMELTEELKDEIARRVAALSFNRYPDPLAMKACAAFGRRYGVDSEFITAGNGSDELISVLLNTFTQRGDRVLITEPDFSMYSIYCTLAETEPVVLGKRGDLSFCADDMIKLANNKKVKLILFSNPCNPTGQGILAEDVLRIADNVNCLVVVDEAYMDFWNQSIIRKAPAIDNLIVLRTCSKIGFAAARLGFAVAGKELTSYLRAAKSPYNVNAMTQAAGEVFLSDDRYYQKALADFISSRDSLLKGMRELQAAMPEKIKVFETHTNFVTAQVEHAPDVHEKLKQKGISVRLLAGRYFRVTAGNAKENETFIQELRLLLERM